MVSRRPVTSAVLLGVLIATANSTAAAAATLEYAVKANFLYKFAPFVTWPPQATGPSGTPFRVCVVGRDPFGAALDDAVRGQRVNDHPIVVRRMAGADQAKGCQVVFVGGSEAEPIADTVRALRGQAVLTVTDEQPGASGSAIRFMLRNGRVRFVIDRAAAAQAGLSISSKLLGLAVAVEN